MIPDQTIARALAHPLRARALELLGERVLSPSDLASELGAAIGTVAYHVRLLDEMGLIELVDEIPRRGAVEHLYRAKVRASVAAAPISRDEHLGR